MYTLNYVLREICKLTIFMLCARGIAYLRPREGYEKYFHLLMSMLILLLFMKPVKEFLSGGNIGNEWNIEAFECLLDESAGREGVQAEGQRLYEEFEEEATEEIGWIQEIEITEITVGGEDEP